MSQKGRIYIAGPMRSIPLYNFPAFDAMRDRLRAMGPEVISPADLDRETGFDPSRLPDGWDWHRLPPGFDLKNAIRRDVGAIVNKATAYVLLPGWERSTGARAEAALASWLKLPRLDPDDLEPWQETVCQEADRLVASDRNQDYGHPYEDFSRTALIWQAILGVPVKPEQVGLCMAGLKISRQCHKPKRDNLVDGCGYLKTVDMIQQRYELNGEGE